MLLPVVLALGEVAEAVCFHSARSHYSARSEDPLWLVFCELEDLDRDQERSMWERHLVCVPPGRYLVLLPHTRGTAELTRVLWVKNLAQVLAKVFVVGCTNCGWCCCLD